MEMRVKMCAIFVRLGVLFAEPGLVPLSFRENVTPKTLSRETSKARDVTLQARSQTSTQTVASLGLL